MAKSHSWGKEFLQKQKQVLETKQSECLKQRQRVFSGLAAIERDELKDSVDLANAILEQHVSRERANSCAEEIFKISQAILNIKNGTYGLCDGCEEEISIKRLKAIPWATKCTTCQRAEELQK